MVTVGLAWIVRIPDPAPVQSLPSVATTLYVPATDVLKLPTLPGFIAPGGTVHA